MIRDRLLEPSACQHCGIPEREHFQRWNSAAGWHQWTPPTDEQIKARMRARRAARLAPRAPLDPATIVTLTATHPVRALAAALKAAIPDELVEARLAALHAQAEAS